MIAETGLQLPLTLLRGMERDGTVYKSIHFFFFAFFYTGRVRGLQCKTISRGMKRAGTILTYYFEILL